MYYTTNPNLPLSQWESQFVDNNKLTTVSDLIPHTIYTIRVEAYTAIGPGPPSPPVQVLNYLINVSKSKTENMIEKIKSKVKIVFRYLHFTNYF